MCGIVGLVHKNKTPIDEGILRKMGSILHHRGPDDEGIFLSDGIGFFHKRLSIIDLKSGHQPMTYAECTIVFNGEIYNYIELRQQMIQKGHTFQTQSDTEVILKMYLEYGEASFGMLNGMFAFLLFDAPNRRLLTVRDHLGIKPLYFYENETKIIFASEVKAILIHPDIKAKLNQDALKEYLTFQYTLDEKTLFSGIIKVLAGHYLSIDLHSNDKRLIRYWEPRYQIDTQHNLEYFSFEVHRLLEDSIKLQMRSDVRIGAYLSGGMDSSVVSLLASRYLAQPLNTFTGAFHAGTAYDETAYAEIVAKQCNARIHKVFPTENDFIDVLPQLIYHLDEPVAGPGVFPQYMVSKLASEHVKVILGGQGGDEIFGGYTRYVVAYLEQALKGAIFENNDEGEHVVSLQSILPNLPYLKQYIPMMQQFWKKDAFTDMDLRYFQLIDRSESAMELYTKDYRAEFDVEMIFEKFQKLFNHPNTKSYYNKMTHFDLLASLPALLQVEDRVSMAVSLESRVPLLDHRIIDLICSMPPAMKFKGAEPKFILKKATKHLVPQAILNRKDKMGFPVPLHLWAKNGVGDFIRDTLLSKQCVERGIFKTKKIAQLIDNERAFGRSLWGVLSAELWFRQFIDG